AETSPLHLRTRVRTSRGSKFFIGRVGRSRSHQPLSRLGHVLAQVVTAPNAKHTRITVPPHLSRRQFVGSSAALSLSALIPRGLLAASSAAQKIVVRADAEIGVVRPEFHGHFAEHLGSCVYGGLWVGKNSKVPNVNGHRKLAVDYLHDLGVPVLRWPGGCFADDYHWRDGIGQAAKRPKRVNIHWGGYVEDNSFGTHEYIDLCQRIGAESYLAGNVGSGSPREMRDWVEYCNYPAGSDLSEERTANGSKEPFHVRYWGVGNESW